MKILSLGGAGAVAEHSTRDLAQYSDFEQIVIGDYNLDAAQKLAADLNDSRVSVLQIDANDYDNLVKAFKDVFVRFVANHNEHERRWQYPTHQSEPPS